ncbi:MAG: polysaccharide biosynthesis/export family protein [Bacteroidetes bacterium]|nr:polysaccharide biosynthesis/export family protein [Bacteroidota bacterium]MBU1718606.1 polysaccharide biosynthesis/export family protein [Bacteroidota bacterium]
MKGRTIFFLLLIVVLTSSCKVFQPNHLFRHEKDANLLDVPVQVRQDFRIGTDDQIKMLIKTNKGEKLVHAVDNSLAEKGSDEFSISYLVESDGTVKLPILGRVQLAGLTIREAETFLEEQYSSYFINPFVQVQVSNRRVFVFKGANASIVTLPSSSTTIYEALAISGGIGESKAHKIRLVRIENGKPQIFRLDLSRLSNLQQGNMVLQSNDLIYIVPRGKISQEILASITPYLTLMTTIVAIYSLLNK